MKKLGGSETTFSTHPKGGYGYLAGLAFHVHGDVHEELHAAPKAGGGRRAAHDEEEVAPSQEDGQALKVRLDVHQIIATIRCAIAQRIVAGLSNMPANE